MVPADSATSTEDSVERREVPELLQVVPHFLETLELRLPFDRGPERRKGGAMLGPCRSVELADRDGRVLIGQAMDECQSDGFLRERCRSSGRPRLCIGVGRVSQGE